MHGFLLLEQNIYTRIHVSTYSHMPYHKILICLPNET